MSAQLKVTGLDEIQRKLKELDSKVANKYTRQALRVGAKIIQADAKATAPVDRSGHAKRNHSPGTLKNAIKVRSGQRTRKGTITVLVSISKKWFTGPVFYAAFVAFGHGIGKRLSKYRKHPELDSRQRVPGNPWLDESFERTKNRAAEASIDKLKELIELGE